MAKLHWRKQKTLAMLANRKQAQRDSDPSDPVQTVEREILMEHINSFLITEASSNASPNYIITE